MIAIVAMLAMFVPAGLAQTPVGEATSASHPAHIHAGTCDTLGDIVIPLENVADPSATGESVGPESANGVFFSRTVIDVPVEELVADDHAVNIHLSDDEMGTFIACGDVGGVVTENEHGGSDLISGLAELNGSGYTGMVWFGEDGDQTEVVIVLTQSDTSS